MTGRENLCTDPRFTGWDVDGGYAEFLTVHADYAYPVPGDFDDLHAAPLLCVGIIGYRALRQSQCPPGGRLGIYGFGGSAHLVAQVAIGEGLRVHVLTRSAQARQLALELGAASAGGAADPPPELLDAALLFAPVGTLVLPALEALDRGGRRDRGHPSERRSAAELSTPPVPGTNGAERHGQHGRRPATPRGRGADACARRGDGVPVRAGERGAS